MRGVLSGAQEELVRAENFLVPPKSGQKTQCVWLIRIETRLKHYQDMLLGQNKPHNLNLTQKFGLEKSLSGFFPSWSLHIYHIYIYISKK